MTPEELQTLLAEANSRYAAEVDEATHRLATAQMDFTRDYEAAQQRLTSAIFDAQHRYSQSVLAENPLTPSVDSPVQLAPVSSRQTSPQVTPMPASVGIPRTTTAGFESRIDEMFDEMLGKSRADTPPSVRSSPGEAVSAPKPDEVPPSTRK